jgi:Rad3-related DNA helicase
MKIPFPNLGDELVLRKSKLFPTWYNSETSNVVIQSIGRGNRHKDDYCTTYILDGNFVRLYTQTSTQYPQELKNRFKFINYGI